LNNIKSTVGEARFALGFLGLLFLILNYKKKNFGYAVLFSWAVMIFLMSFKPNWLFIDLPSNRIGNYLSYPVTILSAYAFCYVFLNNKNSSFLFKTAFGMLLIFVLMGGIGDSVNAFRIPDSANELAQTFHSAQYLSGKVNDQDMVLKDHNYITGDVWMKSFFMRGYRYPLSRSYFQRYEDQLNPREMCTLQMISTPASSEAQNCFSETSTNFLVVNPQYDTAQFLKLNNFDKIYANKDLIIFYRK
jgi:asparagine N-glycosylation enzyme membrane subunit Stt3